MILRYSILSNYEFPMTNYEFGMVFRVLVDMLVSKQQGFIMIGTSLNWELGICNS